jgi:hypothetical protein
MQSKRLTTIHTVCKLLQCEKHNLRKVSLLKDVYEHLKLYHNYFNLSFKLLPILLKLGYETGVSEKEHFAKSQTLGELANDRKLNE